MCSHSAHVIELGLVASGSVRDEHVTAYLYSDGSCFWNVGQLVKAVLPGRQRKPCKLWDSWCGAALPVLRESGLPERDLVQPSKRTLQQRGEPYTDKTREILTASTALVIVSTLLQSLHSGTITLRETYSAFSDVLLTKLLNFDELDKDGREQYVYMLQHVLNINIQDYFEGVATVSTETFAGVMDEACTNVWAAVKGFVESPNGAIGVRAFIVTLLRKHSCPCCQHALVAVLRAVDGQLSRSLSSHSSSNPLYTVHLNKERVFPEEFRKAVLKERPIEDGGNPCSNPRSHAKRDASTNWRWRHRRCSVQMQANWRHFQNQGCSVFHIQEDGKRLGNPARDYEVSILSASNGGQCCGTPLPPVVQT
eukprot:5314966-Amphidinium_carterae.2